MYRQRVSYFTESIELDWIFNFLFNKILFAANDNRTKPPSFERFRNPQNFFQFRFANKKKFSNSMKVGDVKWRDVNSKKHFNRKKRNLIPTQIGRCKGNSRDANEAILCSGKVGRWPVTSFNIIFLKKLGQTRPLFGLFSFFLHEKYSPYTVHDKSIDGVLGTRTPGGRTVGADESTELLRHPGNPVFKYFKVE